MTAPIRSVPVAGEQIAIITSYPELIEAFRAVKARLGLSNKWCDATCDFADGVTDKLLGPSTTKILGPLAFSMFCQIFAVKFRMEIDLDAVRKMEAHWERREEGKVAFPEWRISKKLVETAKPYVQRQNGKAGGLKRAASLPAKLRKKIARKGGKSRMKKIARAERSVMMKKGWETRRARISAAAQAAIAQLEAAPAPPQLSHIPCTSV